MERANPQTIKPRIFLHSQGNQKLIRTNAPGCHIAATGCVATLPFSLPLPETRELDCEISHRLQAQSYFPNALWDKFQSFPIYPIHHLFSGSSPLLSHLTPISFLPVVGGVGSGRKLRM